MKLGSIQWTVIAVHDGPGNAQYIDQVPRIFRRIFLRNLYAWLVAYRLSRRYDFVLMRHLTFDPFAFVFAPFIRNRVSVHHSKESEELRLVSPGWKGRVASSFERLSGKFGIKRAFIVAGVTKEIAEYENVFHSLDRPTAVFPNGIDPDGVPVVPDNRPFASCEMLFISGKFSSWHGLDRLIDAVEAAPALHPAFVVHLVGKVLPSELDRIGNSKFLSGVFKVHGLLESKDYRAVASRCVIGVASLALDRKGLDKASTLKVREMLAMGLPVYSTHQDDALPEDFPYYFRDGSVSVPRLMSFAEPLVQTPRELVANKAYPYIAKKYSMQRLASRIQEVLMDSLQRDPSLRSEVRNEAD